jgi:hypothetical protein
LQPFVWWRACSPRWNRSSVESPGSFRCLAPELAAPAVQNATSAAYAPNGTLAVLGRDPAVLVLVGDWILAQPPRSR